MVKKEKRAKDMFKLEMDNGREMKDKQIQTHIEWQSSDKYIE